MIQIRQAQITDLPWVNQQYHDIGFVPSNLTKEIVAIAECFNEKAGVGRLVSVDKRHAERGGMYVLDQFRQQGIVGNIVNFLLAHADKLEEIDCLPFAHLRNFYQSFGFIECRNLENIPKEIKDKHAWCNETYSHEV